MNITAKILLSGALFLITLGSGIWVSQLGKPYHTVLFNIHKLISLVFIGLTGYLVYDLQKDFQWDSWMWNLLSVSILTLLILIITGGLLSAIDSHHKILLIIHSFTPILAAVSIIGLIIYLMKNTQG